MASKTAKSKTKKDKKKKTRSRIRSYARIKPMDADKDGGIVAARGIAGWDAANGVVEIGAPGSGVATGGRSGARAGGAKVYSHFAATIPPEAAQADVYDAVCAPLVASWLQGFDVELIFYVQSGSGLPYTMSAPPHAMARAAAGLGDGGQQSIAPDGAGG